MRIFRRHPHPLDLQLMNRLAIASHQCRISLEMSAPIYIELYVRITCLDKFCGGRMLLAGGRQSSSPRVAFLPLSTVFLYCCHLLPPGRFLFGLQVPLCQSLQPLSDADLQLNWSRGVNVSLSVTVVVDRSDGGQSLLNRVDAKMLASQCRHQPIRLQVV